MTNARRISIIIISLVFGISWSAFGGEQQTNQNRVRVALASLRLAKDTDAAVAKIRKTLTECGEQGVAIVCFPEVYLPGLRGADRDLPPVNQLSMKTALQEIAIACGDAKVAAIVGMEWNTERGLENRAFVIDRNGTIIGHQTKNQITPGGESKHYVPDGKRQMFTVDGVRFGVSICHEGWRYPETVRWAAVRGAQIVFQPQVTGSDHRDPAPEAKWGESFYEKAMQCRAQENSVYFVSVNRAMKRQNSASSVIDPKGNLVEFVPRGEEKVLVVDLDLSAATGFYASRYQPNLYEERRQAAIARQQPELATEEPEPEARSHPALRELPRASQRLMTKGPAHFVDPKSGNDNGPGSKERPWSTINHALKQLQAGDTLYLREGSYFENVYCAVAGTADMPITIRAYPGERVVIDGGMPEFQTAPAAAWQPFPDGASGEYVSTQIFKNIRDVVGAFGDSSVGLQTYWHSDDLRAANEMWIVDKETKAIDPIYCGPGLWYNKQTGRIHARLAHTHIDNPEVANYAGATDPRKLPLVIAPFNSVPLFVDQAMHVRFQDLVIRGGGLNTVVLQFGVDVEFDNVTIFAGTYGIRARSTGPFRMVNSAVHGSIPPWGFRNENSLHTYTPRFYDPFHKEPGTHRRNIARLPTHALVVTEGTYEFEVFAYPRNHDWEISHCDFTDGHDGVYLSGHTIRFHHNRVDNIQDDAIYLSSPVPYFTDDIFIYQNLITRSLMAFGCHSRGGPNGNIYIFRNVADLRNGVNAGRPAPDTPHGRITSYHVFLMHGRGKPLGVESLYFYQNTFVSNAASDAFAHRTLSKTNSVTQRRVFNNIFIYLNRYGRLRPFNQEVPPDVQCDGNLHWCAAPDTPLPEEFLERIRNNPVSIANKEKYSPGWASKSIVAEPGFLKFDRDGKTICDYRLQEDSPAIGAGIALPDELEDPFRPKDGARPDIGALPHSAGVLAAGRLKDAN